MPNAEPRSLTFVWLLRFASLFWIAGSAYFCWQNWPILPLDMSGSDPATKAAFDAAVIRHVLRATLIGISVPSVLVALGWLADRADR
jgi:hypothetical protein